MKRLIIVGFFTVLGFCLYANGEGEKVLLYIRHGTSGYDTDYRIKTEVDVMISMMKSAGFKVVIASSSGDPIAGETRKLEPNLKLVDVNVEDYRGIIIPCFCRGSILAGWYASPEEISLVQEAIAKKKPVAAQKGAIIILAEAGVLAGKKYANYQQNLWIYESYKDAIYSGDGVVRDGLILTSAYCPNAAKNHAKDDGTPELTRLFIEAIKD